MATAKTKAKDPNVPEVKLGKFEGREVLATRISVTNTGDGLSEPMDVDPQVLHHGEEVFLVVKGVVADVRHPFVKGTEGVARTHVIRAVEGTIVDEGEVSAMLEAQRERIRLHHEAAAGVQRLIPSGDEPAAS